MSAAEAKKKLLEAVLHGIHDGRNVPVHATGSLDLAILDLAMNGDITLDQLLNIYPDRPQLMTHLGNVQSDFLAAGAAELGVGVGLLLRAISEQRNV